MDLLSVGLGGNGALGRGTDGCTDGVGRRGTDPFLGSAGSAVSRDEQFRVCKILLLRPRNPFGDGPDNLNSSSKEFGGRVSCSVLKVETQQ